MNDKYEPCSICEEYIEGVICNKDKCPVGRIKKEIQTAKAEAIKEFAERLKEKAEYHENGEGWEGYIYYADDINNLVKEMAGDAE